MISGSPWEPGKGPRRRWLTAGKAPTTFTAAVCLLLLGAIVATQWSFPSAPGHRASIMVYLLPIVVSAYLGGTWPALFAAGVSGVVGGVFALPAGSFTSLDHLDQVARLIALVVSGVVIALVGGWMNRARDEVDAELRRRLELESRTRALLETTYDWLWEVDTEGRYTYASGRVYELLGYWPEEILGHSLFDLMPPEEADRIRMIFAATSAEHMPFVDLENVNLHRDGHLVHLETSGVPIFDSNGVFAGYRGCDRDITARRQAEEAQRQNDATLKLLANLLPAVIAYLDREGRYVWANRAIESWFGIDAEAVRGQPLREFVDSAAWPLVESYLQRALVGERVTYQRRVTFANGELRWVDVTYTPDFDTAGRQRGTVMMVNDIDYAKRIEQDLARSETMYRSVVSSIPGAIVAVVDHDLRLLSLGGALANRWGLEAKQLEGHRIEEIPFKPMRTNLLERFRRALDGQTLSYDTEYGIVALHSAFAPLRDEKGEVSAALSLTMDVTEHRSAEREALDAATRLRAALDASELGTLIWDIPRNSASWDDAAERVWGVSSAEMNQVPPEDFGLRFVHPLDQVAAGNAWRQFVEGDSETVQLEFRTLRPDGQLRWIGLRGQLEWDAEGMPLRMVGTYGDITERKRVEEGLLQSQKLEALGTLAGGIAHDFNNILLAITGNARLATDDLPAEHPARVSLSEISRAAARAVELVRRILVFSRPSEGEFQVLQLPPVVEEALRLLRASLPAMIEIRTDFKGGVPPIAGDATQIHQILVNLGANSAHAIGSKAGIIEVGLTEVEVSAAMAAAVPGLHEGAYAEISFRDNGCGMDQATMRRVFEPFFTTKPSEQGTGLGLTLVHGIVKGHDGAISVSSEPGVGTVIRVYLPAAAGPVVAPQIDRPPEAHGHGERVLYVDDDEMLVFLIERVLGKLGYRVQAFNDPLQALAEFRARPDRFDVVVTDVSMPSMSGLHLAREMLAVRPGMPIIVTSGYVRPEDEAASREIGVRAIVPKPHTADDLGRELDRMFRRPEPAAADR